MHVCTGDQGKLLSYKEKSLNKKNDTKSILDLLSHPLFGLNMHSYTQETIHRVIQLSCKIVTETS